MADDNRLRTGDAVPRNTQASSQAEVPQPEFRPGSPAEYMTFALQTAPNRRPS